MSPVSFGRGGPSPVSLEEDGRNYFQFARLGGGDDNAAASVCQATTDGGRLSLPWPRDIVELLELVSDSNPGWTRSAYGVESGARLLEGWLNLNVPLQNLQLSVRCRGDAEDNYATLRCKKSTRTFDESVSTTMPGVREVFFGCIGGEDGSGLVQCPTRGSGVLGLVGRSGPDSPA